MTLTPGDCLGPYEIVGLIGAGGMGEVYRARDSRLRRHVAIKTLPFSVSRDAERLRRFRQEVLAAASLNHPNILTVYDIGIHEDVPYVVTELLEGRSLREQLDRGALRPSTGVAYARQLAAGLVAAHDKGIVHRDLKPENIFVTEDGRVKILDFGIAKLSEGFTGSVRDAPTATASGIVFGTVGYMSPEQVRGLAVDHRSDIFSFGADVPTSSHRAPRKPREWQ